MSTHYVYLVIDICCIIVPLAASFYPAIGFYKQWRYAVPAILITAIVFLVWDEIFTRQSIWSFNSRYILGYYYQHLPIEEILFFVCIPYACLFVFHCIELFVKVKHFRWVNFTTWGLAILLLIIGITHLQLFYTSVTFLSLGIILFIAAITKPAYMARFYVAFLLALIPFFISNGLLTGSWLQEPVVMYNNNYNLNIRLATIPIEDIFYGMEFQLLNVILYKMFQKTK